MNEKETLLPCATCPWRVEKGAKTIPLYSQDAALALRNTVGDGDALRRIMACHHSAENDPISCRGYLAQVGYTNINVRIFLAQGKLPSLNAIKAACKKAEIKLHRNYGQMMDKLTLSYERKPIEGRAPSHGTSSRPLRCRKERGRGMSEKEVCPTCGSNSVTYNSQFIAEPLMMKCPACGGYHAGGCHKEAAGETRGELLKGRKGIEMEFIENSAKVLLERLEALGVIASIENRDWPEGKLADDGEIIVAISNHLKAFLREHWPDVQKLGS